MCWMPAKGIVGRRYSQAVWLDLHLHQTYLVGKAGQSHGRPSLYQSNGLRNAQCSHYKCSCGVLRGNSLEAESATRPEHPAIPERD